MLNIKANKRPTINSILEKPFIKQKVSNYIIKTILSANIEDPSSEIGISQISILKEQALKLGLLDYIEKVLYMKKDQIEISNKQIKIISKPKEITYNDEIVDDNNSFEGIKVKTSTNSNKLILDKFGQNKKNEYDLINKTLLNQIENLKNNFIQITSKSFYNELKNYINNLASKSCLNTINSLELNASEINNKIINFVNENNGNIYCLNYIKQILIYQNQISLIFN